MSLELLNNIGIFYDNKCQALYNKKSWRLLTFAQYWERSFFLHLLNNSDSVVNLLKVKNNIYMDKLPKFYQTQNTKLLLIILYKYFGHLNFPALWKHLTQYDIYYKDNKSQYNSCKRAKVIKHYNQTSLERIKKQYKFVYIDLMSPITLVGFNAKKYFFIFTDDHICITEIYTWKKKSKCLKV